MLTADLSYRLYEPHTDRIVAVTFGRGIIYSLVGSKKALATAQASCH